MHFRIMDSAGNVYESDPSTKEMFVSEFSSEFDAKEGYQQVIDLLKRFKDLNYLSLVISGQKRIFNPAHIVWTEVVNPFKGWDDV